MKRQPREMKTICAPRSNLKLRSLGMASSIGIPFIPFYCPWFDILPRQGQNSTVQHTVGDSARRASTRLVRAQRSDSVRKLINSVSVHCRTGTLSTGRSFFLQFLCSAVWTAAVNGTQCQLLAAGESAHANHAISAVTTARLTQRWYGSKTFNVSIDETWSKLLCE